MAQPRRGRPTNDPKGRPSAAVHLKLAPMDFDRADRHARDRRESIQDVIRRGLRRILTDERGL